MGRRPFIADQLRTGQRWLQQARREMDMDDNAYRAVLLRVTGVSSSKDIQDPALYLDLRAEFQRLGYQPKARKSNPTEGRPRNTNTSPQLQKIEALLADMALPWAYLVKSKRGPSMCRRLAGVDRLEFATGEGLAAIIAALLAKQAKQVKG